MERQGIPMVAADWINEAGDPVPSAPGQAERPKPKAPYRLVRPSELDGLGFVRYVLILRRHPALLKQAHQFSGHVVNLGLD